jgi:hypothetical protein
MGIVHGIVIFLVVYYSAVRLTTRPALSVCTHLMGIVHGIVIFLVVYYSAGLGF